MFNEETKRLKIINKIFNTFNLGEVNNYELTSKEKYILYHVFTPNKEYYLLEYNHKTIPNEKVLNTHKQQLNILKNLSTNGVHVILPLSFNDKYFIKYCSKYYLIYEYQPYSHKTLSSLNEKHLKKLANTLAIIHKLNIKSSLPYQEPKLNIDLSQILKKAQKINETLYQTIYNNYFLLEDLINKVNENLKYINSSLCINDNDFYLSNILWQKDFLYLINYTSITTYNPLVSLAELAFYYSYIDDKINYDYYKTFLKTYLKKYGPLKTDYKFALYIAPLKTLNNLNDKINNYSKKDNQKINDIISIINKLTTYYNNIETFNKISLLAVKKH